MVATILKLRWRLLFNTFARRPWQLVGFCFGVLWGIGMVLAAIAGLIALASVADLTLSRTLLTIAGGLLILGWWIGPILVSGTDSTVEIAQLAPFPLRRSQLTAALIGIGLTGIPGVAAIVLGFVSVFVWVAWPAALIVAVPAATIGVLLCVIGSRLASVTSSGSGGGRRVQEITGTIALIAIMLVGPILAGITALLSSTDDLPLRLRQVADVVAWTPLGAAWAAPASAASGAWLVAVAQLAIAAATLGALWWLFVRSVTTALTSPPRRTTRTVKAGSLGLFGVAPTGPVGATWARSLRNWLRDPRYSRQLLIGPIVPIVVGFTGGFRSEYFAWSSIFVAVILAFASYTDVSYDGTAFASVLATGIRGRADRVGRALGFATAAIPVYLFAAVVTIAVSGHWEPAPVVIGLGLGIVLVGIGVCAVSSALIISPVARPGDSPFKSVPGQTFLNGLLVFVVMAAVAALSIPSIALTIAAVISGSDLWMWGAGAASVLIGVGVAGLGVFVGGKAFDGQAPALLARIKALPNS